MPDTRPAAVIEAERAELHARTVLRQAVSGNGYAVAFENWRAAADALEEARREWAEGELRADRSGAKRPKL